MRKTRCAVCVVSLLLGAVRAVQSGDEGNARAIIDKAIKASGGEANLSKQKAFIIKGTGTFYGLGEGLPFTGEWSMRLPNQMRATIESKANGQAFRMVRVLNADKGWIKINDDVANAMSKDELDEEREELYGDLVATLVPLKDKAFKLGALGEVKVEGRDAVGVRVSRKDHRDVSLFFDKDSGLLVRTENRVKDVENGGKELTQEALMSDFRTVEGVKHAMKTLIKRDGKRFVEVEWTDFRLVDKLDDSVFAMP
jgi:hypothetical protein